MITDTTALEKKIDGHLRILTGCPKCHYIRLEGTDILFYANNKFNKAVMLIINFEEKKIKLSKCYAV